MLRSKVLAAVMLIGPLALGYAQTPTQTATKPDLSETVEHLMEAEASYEKMQPNGTAIEAKEVSRSGESGKDLVVGYHLFIRGVKAGTVFQEIDWPITAEQPAKSLAAVSLGADGILTCGGKTPEECGEGNKPGEPINFVTHPKPGEPIRLAFEAEGIKIGLVLVPDPIRSRDKLCTLEAVRLTPGFEGAYITGSGYPANNEVHYRMTPLSDKDLVVKADAAGTIRTSVVLNPGGDGTGRTVKIKVNEQDCSPEISYVVGSM